MADRTLIPADPEIWRRTGQAVPLCTCGAMEDETRACACPQACQMPEPVTAMFRAFNRGFWRGLHRGLYIGIGAAALVAIFWPH